MSDNIGYSMLIVDDEKLVRQKILRAVDCKKHNITNIEEAANGVEGLSQIMQNMPDIILLDICMPRMDGVEFASIVREGASFHSNHFYHRLQRFQEYAICYSCRSQRLYTKARRFFSHK